jgi:hypothetical protein
VAHTTGGTVLTACENGYGKRTPLEDYPIKNRGGQGVINIKASPRNGAVVELKRSHDGDDVMFITQSGMIVRSPVDEMRPMGRAAQGVRLVNLKEGDRLVAAEVVAAADLEVGPTPDPGQVTPVARRASAPRDDDDADDLDEDELEEDLDDEDEAEEDDE